MSKARSPRGLVSTTIGIIFSGTNKPEFLMFWAIDSALSPAEYRENEGSKLSIWLCSLRFW